MENKVILLLSDQLGQGDKQLGEAVLETYFTHIKQLEQKPKAVFCMNRGVLTMTDRSLVSVHLKELTEQGVAVLACKTCADYYHVSDKLTAGELSGMDKFIELSSQYEVITIS